MFLQNSFEGKRVLVTGGGRGFGRAVVKRLHSYGAEVIALSRTPESLKSLEKECPGVKTICVDIGDWNRTRDLLQKVEAVDCLVNNAAVLKVKTALEIGPEDVDEILNVNLKSVLNICQVVSQKMIEAGKSGSIVNVSSIGAVRPFPLVSAYSVSKAALEMLSRVLAIELAPKKIRVNIFQPAGMDTDMLKHACDEMDAVLGGDSRNDVMLSRTPTKTLLMPMEECVNSLLFLLSDLSPQMVGSTVTIDGGFLCT